MCTLVLLHGFSSNAHEFREKLSLPDDPGLRTVFVNAPVLPITCYGGRRMRSWHDYLTNHGDVGDAVEEKVAGLDRTRDHLRHVVERERRRAPDRPVVLVGESQGACVAIDLAATTVPDVAVVAMYGQRYAESLPRWPFPLYSLHGGRDTVIPTSVALESLAPLSPARVLVDPNASHAEYGDAAASFLREAVEDVLATVR